MAHDPVAEIIGRYFRRLHEATGIPWDDACDAEMRTLSDEIRRTGGREAARVTEDLIGNGDFR